MARVVLDVNVLVSAVISPLGPPAALVDAWRRGDLELIVSEQLLAEFSGVLRRPQFRRWISVDEVDALVLHFRRRGPVYEDDTEPARVATDPKDDYLIALATKSEADALVTGDVSLREAFVATVALISPREFMDRLRRSPPTT